MVKEITGGRGVDLAVEGAGTIEAFSEGPSYVRIGGAYAVAGIAEPRDLLPLRRVPGRGAQEPAHAAGVWVSGTSHLRQSLSLVKRDPEAFAALVTHRFSLDEATQAMETVASRKAMKAVIHPQGRPAAR